MENIEIKERRIIDILLKHLMNQRNEIAYLKNKAALNTPKSGVSELRDGAKGANHDNKDLSDGAKGAVYSDKLISDGAKGAIHSNNDLSNGAKGANHSNNDLSNGAKGANHSDNDLSNGAKGAIHSNQDLSDGAKGTVHSDKDLSNGAKGAIYSNNDLSDGAKGALDALSVLTINENGGNLLYSVFEQELLIALEDYIKNGDGQTTLYEFYEDFLAAIEAKNLAAAKTKAAAINTLLEDTHSLPAQITTAGTSFSTLKFALQGHYPQAFNTDMYHTLAHELLLLHNAGKATSAELRGFGGLSPAGFRKHLTKIVSLNLIKRQAPSHYVLTSHSHHILLELFGIENGK